MLKHLVDTHLDRIFEVHLPCETHVVVVEANDVVIYNFITSLFHMRQLNNGEVLLHGHEVFPEDVLHGSPTTDGSNWQTAIPVKAMPVRDPENWRSSNKELLAVSPHAASKYARCSLASLVPSN